MRPGDKVLVDGMLGTVICDADASEYSDAYPESQWAAVLKTGVLVQTEEAGLIHYPDATAVVAISS